MYILVSQSQCIVGRNVEGGTANGAVAGSQREGVNYCLASCAHCRAGDDLVGSNKQKKYNNFVAHRLSLVVKL